MMMMMMMMSTNYERQDIIHNVVHGSAIALGPVQTLGYWRWVSLLHCILDDVYTHYGSCVFWCPSPSALLMSVECQLLELYCFYYYVDGRYGVRISRVRGRCR